jgi:hypothetical protein
MTVLERLLHLSQALQDAFKDVGTPLRRLGGNEVIFADHLEKQGFSMTRFACALIFYVDP